MSAPPGRRLPMPQRGIQRPPSQSALHPPGSRIARPGGAIPRAPSGLLPPGGLQRRLAPPAGYQRPPQASQVPTSRTSLPTQAGLRRPTMSGVPPPVPRGIPAPGLGARRPSTSGLGVPRKVTTSMTSSSSTEIGGKLMTKHSQTVLERKSVRPPAPAMVQPRPPSPPRGPTALQLKQEQIKQQRQQILAEQKRKRQMQMQQGKTASAPAVPTALEMRTQYALRRGAEMSSTALKASAAQRKRIQMPTMVVDQAAVPVDKEYTTSKSIMKAPGGPDIVSRSVTTLKKVRPGVGEKVEVVVQRTVPNKRPPLKPETVTIKKTTSIAGGIKKKSKTVTYDGDDSHLQRTPKRPSPAQVSRLVDEENAAIEETKDIRMPRVMADDEANYSIRKKDERFLPSPEKDSMFAAMKRVAVIRRPQILDASEATPETIANMMNVEECGVPIGSSPASVYKYLFHDLDNEPLVQVSSAAPMPLEDVVIPDKLPWQAREIEQQEDIANISIAGRDVAHNLNESTYCKKAGNQPLHSKNASHKGGKTKRKRVRLLQREVPPWGLHDLEGTIDIVGGGLNPARAIPEPEKEATAAEAQPTEDDYLTEGIEYLLQMETPEYYSQVQLRGSQPPSWFPGYIMALPNLPNGIAVAKSPSEVFTAAWRAVQPEIFNDDSLIIG